MDIQSLVSEVRDNYVRQFDQFVEKLNQDCNDGHSEVKLNVGGTSSRYRSLYCGDFVCSDNGFALTEMTPDQILTFSPMDGFVGDTRLKITSMCWDDIHITHDAHALPKEEIARWFDHWFDENDSRLRSESEFAGVIHALDIVPGHISIDFGTAQPEAFWSLFQIILDAKPTLIEISTGRIVTEEG